MKAKYLNTEIKKAIKEKGLKHCEVANGLGIGSTTFSTWLQTELTPERKERVLNVLENYTGKPTKELNKDVRTAIHEKGLAHYEIANAIGIAPISFARWLEKELSEEQKQRVYAAIEKCMEE